MSEKKFESAIDEVVTTMVEFIEGTIEEAKNQGVINEEQSQKLLSMFDFYDEEESEEESDE